MPFRAMATTTAVAAAVVAVAVAGAVAVEVAVEVAVAVAWVGEEALYRGLHRAVVWTEGGGEGREVRGCT